MFFTTSVSASSIPPNSLKNLVSESEVIVIAHVQSVQTGRNEIIEKLYLRLGYTMLLEWGNSSYFDNDGNYIADNPHSLSDEFLLGRLGYDTIYNKIQDKRLASCGNYDALIGKVVNFSWNFTKDLTYEITLKIISMGDVIESLKTNALLPGGSLDTSTTTPATDSKPPAPTPESVIKDFSTVHEVGKMFYEKQQILAPLASGKEGISVITESNLEYNGSSNNNSVSFFKQVYKDKGATQYYVRFGRFLEFISGQIIPKVKDQNQALNSLML